MIRVVIFLILVALLALGAAWLADRPGEVIVTWQGMRIETSVMVLAAGLLAAVAALMILWTLLSVLPRAPFILRRHLHRRRGQPVAPTAGRARLQSDLAGIGSDGRRRPCRGA